MSRAAGGFILGTGIALPLAYWDAPLWIIVASCGLIALGVSVIADAGRSR